MLHDSYFYDCRLQRTLEVWGFRLFLCYSNLRITGVVNKKSICGWLSMGAGEIVNITLQLRQKCDKNHILAGMYGGLSKLVIC